MTAAVKLVGKVAAGFVDYTADKPRTPEWAEKLASIPLNRMTAKQAPARKANDQLRSAISLPGNPHMAGVASLFPLRAELAADFRPTHLSDSTDLFHPSFDVRGPVAASGIEAHLTFSVQKDAEGDWQLFQVTPTSGYPGIRIDDAQVIRHVATTTLQAVTAERLKSGLPWEPGVLTTGSRVIEALRDLLKQAN
jgi:hypothetical protein